MDKPWIIASWNRSFHHSSFKSPSHRWHLSVRKETGVPCQSGFRRTVFRNQFTSLCARSSLLTNAMELAVCRWNTPTYCPTRWKTRLAYPASVFIQLKRRETRCVLIEFHDWGPVGETLSSLLAIISISIIQMCIMLSCETIGTSWFPSGSKLILDNTFFSTTWKYKYTDRIFQINRRIYKLIGFFLFRYISNSGGIEWLEYAIFVRSFSNLIVGSLR